ncbi:hypothetical protein R1flu_027595 [Riccia fluitans]|uniref:Uncharacterized protein n=1 Tax=Riccia fluitans TaxID=41844 RepID=A0ABD1XJ88_9MARC
MGKWWTRKKQKWGAGKKQQRRTVCPYSKAADWVQRPAVHPVATKQRQPAKQPQPSAGQDRTGRLLLQHYSSSSCLLRLPLLLYTGKLCSSPLPGPPV